MKYVTTHRDINIAGQVVYHMQLDATRGCILTYNEPQTQAVLDKDCDQYLAYENANAAKQALIDKAIAQAFWTEDERKHLSE
tara:strand:+ start:158 stop:403 length:246 start_codon:yes stop_codon:yes gene_type:complete